MIPSKEALLKKRIARLKAEIYAYKEGDEDE